MEMENVVFALAGLGILASAVGVVISRHPVHSALSLVATLFGIAVLFVAQDAQFLAAVQVIVYAGAVVVLFLFVIMLLGVDREDDIETEPLAGQRPLAAIAGVGLLGAALATLFLTNRDYEDVVVGTKSQVAPLSGSSSTNLEKLAHALFTDYLYAFEITSVLLVIAVVGAVVLARRPPRSVPSAGADA